MQKNLPIFLTCSVLALSFNGAVGYAQQGRQMAIPGQSSASITPPLMIEAGDWDAPTNTSQTGRSLFAEPTSPSADEKKQPTSKVGVDAPKASPTPASVAPKSEQANPQKKQTPAQLPSIQKVDAPSPPQPTAPNMLPIDAAKATWGSLNVGGSTTLPVEPVSAPPPPVEKAESPSSGSDIGPRALPVKRPAALPKTGDDAKKVAVAAPAPAQPAPEPAKPRFTGMQGKAKAPELAVLPKGAAVNGDVLKMTRSFEDWTLSCDMQLELNERVCRIEQSIPHSTGEKLTWKIATKQNGRPVIVFDFSERLDPSKGLEVSFSGFEKSLPATDWACDNGKCQTSMDIVGPVAGWFSDAPQIAFSFTRDGQKVKIDASMKGFQQAMAASQNPLGQKAESKPTADLPQPKNEKTAQLK